MRDLRMACIKFEINKVEIISGLNMEATFEIFYPKILLPLLLFGFKINLKKLLHK